MRTKRTTKTRISLFPNVFAQHFSQWLCASPETISRPLPCRLSCHPCVRELPRADSCQHRGLLTVCHRYARQSPVLRFDVHIEGTPLEDPDAGKNPHAVALGRMGGKKGGKARAEKLSPAKRKAIAKNAARKRWGRD